jgi:hypothetical protein
VICNNVKYRFVAHLFTFLARSFSKQVQVSVSGPYFLNFRSKQNSPFSDAEMLRKNYQMYGAGDYVNNVSLSHHLQNLDFNNRGHEVLLQLSDRKVLVEQRFLKSENLNQMFQYKRTRENDAIRILPEHQIYETSETLLLDKAIRRAYEDSLVNTYELFGSPKKFRFASSQATSSSTKTIWPKTIHYSQEEMASIRAEFSLNGDTVPLVPPAPPQELTLDQTWPSITNEKFTVPAVQWPQVFPKSNKNVSSRRSLPSSGSYFGISFRFLKAFHANP